MAKTTATTMTTTIVCVLITTFILLSALPCTEAQAPPPGPDCLDSLANVADCLSYVEDGSNLTQPDPACCPEVANLINTQPICLCELLGNSSQFGFSDIDTNRALQLPSLCNLKAPPVSLCAEVGIPVNTSALSPSEAAANPYHGLASNQHFLIGVTLVLFTLII